MVKKDKSHLFYIIKVIRDVGGRMARDERIFKSLIVLEVYQKKYDYLYIIEKE